MKQLVSVRGTSTFKNSSEMYVLKRRTSQHVENSTRSLSKEKAGTSWVLQTSNFKREDKEARLGWWQAP